MEARQALRDAIAARRSLYGKPCVDAAALFGAIDTGGRIDGAGVVETPDGSISEAELTQAMARLGIALQPEQLHALLVSVDADRDGFISKTEFLRWLQENPAELEAELHRVDSKRKAVLAEMEHERVVAAATDVAERTAVSARAKAKERARLASRNKAFAKADADGSGVLDVRELRAVLHSRGIQTTGAGFEKILAAVDVDGDGKISRAEFDRVSARLKSIAKTAEDDAAKDAEKTAQLKYAKGQAESALRRPATEQVIHDTRIRITDPQLGHDAAADHPQLDRKAWLPSTVVHFDRDGNQVAAAKTGPTMTGSSGLYDAVDAADEELHRAQSRRKAAEADMRRILAVDEAAEVRERMTLAVQAFVSNPIYTRYGSKARALVSRCEQLGHESGAHPYQLLFEGLGQLAEEEGRDAAASQMREKWAVAGRARRAKEENRESQLELEYAIIDNRKAQAVEHQMQLARVRIPRLVAQQAIAGIIDRVVDPRRTANSSITVGLRSVAKKVIDDVLENVELRQRVRAARATGTARRRQVTFLADRLSVAIDNGDSRTSTPGRTAAVKAPGSTSVQAPSKATVTELRGGGGRRVALRECNRTTEHELAGSWSSADAAQWGLKRREAQQRATVLRAKRSRQADELKMRVDDHLLAPGALAKRKQLRQRRLSAPSDVGASHDKDGGVSKKTGVQHRHNLLGLDSPLRTSRDTAVVRKKDINEASPEDIIAACLHTSSPRIPEQMAKWLVDARPFHDFEDAKARILTEVKALQGADFGFTLQLMKKLKALGLVFKPWPLVHIVDSFLAEYDSKWIQPAPAQAEAGSVRFRLLLAECTALSKRTGARPQRLIYKMLKSQFGVDVEEWWAMQQRSQQAKRRAAALVARQQRQQRREQREQELILVQQVE